MSDKSIINFGDLSRPATVLIEKISDAIGGYFKPYQIHRVAKAEAEAEKIKAASQIEVTELQQRALRRFLAEEAKKQENIESITAKTLPQLEDSSTPQDMNEDWITNFFDKCRLISNEEMQSLWSRVLAGEANSPGSYSKRTVNFLSSLDKSDAELFTTLCGFIWVFQGFIPLIYDFDHSVYESNGITFNMIQHLDDIGLLSLNSIGGFEAPGHPKHIQIFYHGTPINVEFPNDTDNALSIGKVLLSRVGKELAPICGSKPVPGFLDYILNYWSSKGLILSSPWPKSE